MAEDETLTLRMRVVNALRASRDIHKVADAAGDVSDETKLVGKASREAEQATSIFGRSLGRANLGFVSLQFSGQAVLYTFAVLVGILPLIALGLSAITAAVALLIPGFALFGGMMMRFKAQQGVAGTAANRLGKAFADVRDAFIRMVAPGADIVFIALAQVLADLRPLLLRLKGPMTAFATGVGQGIAALGAQLPALMPQLIDLFRQGGPALAAIIPSIIPLVSALLGLAVKGLPALVAIVPWLATALTDVVQFLSGIVDWTRTDQGAAYLDLLSRTWTDIGSIISDVTRILADVAPLIGGVGWAAGALLWTLHAIRDVVHWIADNINMTWGEAFAGALGFIQPVFDLVNSIWEKVKAVGNSWAGKVAAGAAHGVGAVTGAAGRLLPGGATGGLVAAGGIGLVGERGPEVVRLPYRARIDPLPASAGYDGPQVLESHITLVLKDGRVLAEEVHRQALQAKAMR